MSSTEIYGVKSNGDVILVGDTENAFRGAMHIWSNLSKKYNIEGSMLGGFQKLWKKVDTEFLTSNESLILKSTFDNVIIKKQNIPLLIEAFKEYDKEFPYSSLLEQIEIIEDEILNDENIIALCWNQTTVNSSPWISYNEKDEEVYYNVLTDDKHWYSDDE